jgi:hypothetical protein
MLKCKMLLLFDRHQVYKNQTYLEDLMVNKLIIVARLLVKIRNDSSCFSPPSPRHRLALYPEPAGWRAGGQKLQPAEVASYDFPGII